jgi:hypothetical protein
VSTAAVYDDSVGDLPNTMIDLAGVGAMEVPVMALHSHSTVLAWAEEVGELMSRTGRNFASVAGKNRP